MTPRFFNSRRLSSMVAALVLSACSSDELLDVDHPDVIEPGKLETPQGATTMYTGTLADFARAHDGTNASCSNCTDGLFGGVVMTSGLFSDEFRFGGTPPEVRQLDLDDVTKENSFFRDTYLALHVAREDAERAAGTLERTSATGSDPRIGEMYAVSGLVIEILGELFCSGIPFSSTLSGSVEYGQPLSTADVFALAGEKFDLATSKAAGDATVTQLAAVGKGRALLNAGQFAQAAQAVAAVPTSFSYSTNHAESPFRVQNLMKGFIFDFDYLSVSDQEGTNGLNFASANDPRVVTNFAGPSRFDGETPHYQYLLYGSYAAPVIVVSGVEARLIEAEAALQANDFTTWIDRLNAARAFFGMGPASDPGTADARVDLMFRERAFSLFATGHRVGDLRRLVRQYGRAANTVYPIGAYHKDQLTRGSDHSFVIPTSEENNPNYSATGCDKHAP
jgi:hypothetical protein